MRHHAHHPATWIAAALLALVASSAMAETSPYYIGVSQSLGHESNLYRVGGSVGLPAGAKSESDTIATTSLVAGVDQTWGRQRLNGSASLRASRFANNDQLNNEGYGLNLGLDWETVARISGRLGVSADRSLRSYDPAYQAGLPAERNIEDNNQVNATVRVGSVTRLTGEATVNARQVRYSAQAYAGSEYNQSGGSLGARYRLGGATTAGLAWRQSQVKYISRNDPYKRRDIDLTGNWTPSGLTNLYARVSHTRTDHSQSPGRDYSGMTAELRGSTQVTGKVKLSTRLSRDLSQGTSTFDFQGQTPSVEFDRVSTAMRLGADYDLSAKIALNASLDHVRRSFEGTRFALTGSDRTTSLNLGARWLPTRAIQVGCNLSHDTRSVSQVGNPYSSNGVNCYGQFVLQ
jgi:Putative beta-barrel porin 2